MKFSKWKILGITAGALILLLACFQLTSLVSFASPLSESEASQLVKDRYNGNVVNIMQKDQNYQITIELDTGTYVVEVNRKTGDIESLTRTGQNNLPNKAEKSEADIIDHTPDHTPGQILTKDDAARIALQHVSGKVDDIDLEQSGGLTYFLVEVERKHAKDATVQINAITGEVMSITWED